MLQLTNCSFYTFIDKMSVGPEQYPGEGPGQLIPSLQIQAGHRCLDFRNAENPHLPSRLIVRRVKDPFRA